MCHAHAHLAHWEQVIQWCEKSALGSPRFWYPWIDLAAANASLAHDREAGDAAARLQKLFPGITVQTWAGVAAQISSDPTFAAQIQRIAEGARKAGVPEGEQKTN
jgi:hypothetical protein